MLATRPEVQNTAAVSRADKSEETRLEDFVYSVAHELRESLRTIGMFSELLVRDVNPDSSREYAQLIVDGVKRMSSMLEGLYEFALSGSDAHESEVDLTRVVSEAVLNLKHAVAVSDAVINVGALPLVKGNERQLVRVLQNLIANAIKYRGDAPIEVQIAAEPCGAEWVVSVRDNGVGIAPEYQEQIFHLFTRLHGGPTRGAGIGLAVCKKLIEAVGGRLWVESKLGAGSSFCFTVAAARPAIARVKVAAAVGSRLS